jgi:CobQ-like glutamine amidotransferase family enzyme
MFFILLLSYVSVLENTMWYDRSLGQRVDVGILGVVTVKSAVDCTIGRVPTFNRKIVEMK